MNNPSCDPVTFPFTDIRDLTKLLWGIQGLQLP
jgi:hypothetical protein